jgi:hypothetical protein
VCVCVRARAKNGVRSCHLEQDACYVIPPSYLSADARVTIIAAVLTGDHDVIKGNETTTSRTIPAGAGAQTSRANKVGFSRRKCS